MREIRYRVWDTILHGWYKGSVDLSYNKDGTVSLYEPRFIFLQFTGLKDMSGEDIYEGDVIGNEGMIDEVANVDGCFVGPRSAKDQFGMHQPIAVHRPFIKLGNIYENPELLGEDK